MMGDLGEQWTASELRKLRRHGWRVINHVLLRAWDIDHVLVGPGGVVAVETKWSATEWSTAPVDSRIVNAAERVRESAHDLSLWGKLRAIGVGEVGSAVFIWGKGASDFEPVRELSGVLIVPGVRAATWRANLGQDRLSDEQVEQAWRVLDAQCRMRDPREQQEHPMPASLSEWAARVIFGWIAVCVGMLLPAAFLAAGHPLLLDGLGLLVLLAVPVALRRLPQFRYIAVAWTLGVVAVAMYAAIVVVRSLMN